MTEFQKHPSVDLDAVNGCFQRYRDGVARLLETEFGGTKAGVVEEVLLLHEAGVLTDADGYALPPILRIERDYPVPRGNVDLMMFHADGTGTVIACNPGCTPSDVLPSVSQVMSDGVQVGASGVLTSVRLMIASRASGEELRPLAPVFKRCRVEPIFCGQFAKLADGMAESMRSRLEPILTGTERVQP